MLNNKNRIAVIVGSLAALTVIVGAVLFVLANRGDDASAEDKSEYTEEVANPDNYDLAPYNDVIYLEQNSFFDNDRWVWIDAQGCPLAPSGVLWTLATREAVNDGFTFEDQMDTLNDNWLPVYEEFSQDLSVGMIALNDLELGFRLPDGTDDETLMRFAEDLDDFLWDNDPCPTGV